MCKKALLLKSYRNTKEKKSPVIRIKHPLNAENYDFLRNINNFMAVSVFFARQQVRSKLGGHKPENPGKHLNAGTGVF